MTGGAHLVVQPSGSLLDAATVTIEEDSSLRLFKPAGTDPGANSVALNGVVLHGGTVFIGNIDPARLMSPATTGGVLALVSGPAFNAGGTRLLDFNLIGGSAIRLAAQGNRAIRPVVSLVPDSLTHTLRFGGAPATLTVDAVVEDVAGVPTHVEQGVSGTTRLAADSTYTGATTIEDGVLIVDHANALGSAVAGTTVNGGRLQINVASPEPIIVSNGTVIVNNSGPASGRTDLNGGLVSLNDQTNPHGGDVHLGGGVLAFSASADLDGALVVTPGNTAQVSMTSAPIYPQVRGGSTGSGTLHLAPQDTHFIGALGVNGAPLSHNGALRISSGETRLWSANTYTGHTTIDGGILEIRHDRALGAASGSDTDGTTVNRGGSLWLNKVTLTDEKIILNGGELGSSTISSVFGPTTINGPIELLDDSVIKGDGASAWDINGVISGDGDLRIGGARLNAANTYSGTTTIIDAVRSSGQVHANHANSFGTAPDELVVQGGQLLIEAPNTVAALRMDGGGLSGSNVLTLLSRAVEMRGGMIGFAPGGGIAGLASIRKHGPKRASLGDLGSGAAPTITVELGILSIGNDPASSTGGVHVTSQRSAAVDVRGDTDLDIHLNNATGFANSGALLGARSGGAHVYGDVHLGDVGSYVSGWSKLTIHGVVSGGTLTKVGGRSGRNEQVRLQNANNTYSGDTVVGLDGEGGLLVVSSAPFTSELTVNRGGALSVVLGQINAAAPLTLHGGLLLSNDDGALPRVAAMTGHSGLSVPSQTQVTLNAFSRAAGTSMSFIGRNGPLGGGGADDPRLLLASSPTLLDGLIGGWATVAEAGTFLKEFATYDSAQGVRALDPVGRPAQVEGATPQDNVLATGPLDPLLADSQINSLRITASGFDFDLGGHTLNVGSGGILTDRSLTISNGRLSAGNVHAAELFLTGDAVLAVDVVDNATGAIGLLVSNGDVALRGNNTYTGPTTINGALPFDPSNLTGDQGVLRLEAAGALPAGTDLNVHGGRVEVRFASTTPLDVGTLALRQGGVILPIGVFGAPLDADAYELESGIILSDLTGPGTITKTTDGYVRLRGVNGGLSGDVLVENGILVGDISSVSSGNQPLGTGTITVAGGRLAIQDAVVPFANPIVLAGGELAGSNASGDCCGTRSLDFSSSIDVMDDSTILTFEGTFDGTAQSSLNLDPIRYDVHLSGPVRLHDDAALATSGDGTLFIETRLHVGQDTSLIVPDGAVDIMGAIQSDAASSSLALSGAGAVNIGANLFVLPDQSLSIVRDGVPTALVVQGRGKFVTGGGTLINDLELRDQGVVRPGGKVGSFTVDGALTWGEGGVYDWQINDALGVP